MTDRERLIEILSKPIYVHENADYVTAVADYLIDNGVIIPPCEVGETVYFLDIRNLVIFKLEVATILISSPKAILLHLTDGKLHGASDYGISLFKTREEAERALKERKNNG